MMRSRLDSDHLFGSWEVHSNPQTGNVAFNSSVELQKILGTAGHCWALQKKMLNVRLLVWPRTMMIKQSLCPVLFKGAYLFWFHGRSEKKTIFQPNKERIATNLLGSPHKLQYQLIST